MASEQAFRALSAGLKFEQDGYSFYLKAAATVEVEEVRATLASLAEEEQVHEAMIARQINALEAEGGFVLIPGVEPVELDLARELFPPDAQAIKGKVGKFATDLEALQYALEVESSSYAHYKQAAQEIEDPDGKLMFRWLAAAELSHFNVLMSIYEATNERLSWQ
ncbi:MAG: ferritin family protein [Anaerolineae bacterium]|jgi:rubrerythrin|nr:ferritin family protein [Chloroflexota bacterium]